MIAWSVSGNISKISISLQNSNVKHLLVLWFQLLLVIHAGWLKVEVLIVLHLLILIHLQVLGNFCNIRQQFVIYVGFIVALFQLFLLLAKSLHFV